MPLLSIIVPVYNEVATIDIVLRAVLQAQLPGVTKQLIIVDGGSEDGTRERVLTYQDIPGVEVLCEPRPAGKGVAIRRALPYAVGDLILIQDGDLEYSVEDYGALLAPLLASECDVVLGSRWMPGHAMRHLPGHPWLSCAMNVAHWGLMGVFNRLYHTRYRDIFGAYKVFRRHCLDGVTFHANRFAFDVELVIRFVQRGYVPQEVPVRYQSRTWAQGKKVRWIDGVQVLWTMVRLWRPWWGGGTKPKRR